MNTLNPAELRNEHLDKLKPLDPLAEIFPWMPAEDFNKLIEDIKSNGQHQAILTHEGKVVDGKHRELAAVMAGKEPMYQAWDGNGSLINRIVSDNWHRRHLSESQRAVIAAQLWPSFAKEIEKEKTENSRKFARNVKKQAKGQAAQAMNVSERSVDDAITVLDKGTEEQKAAVASDELAVSAVAKEIRQESKLEAGAALPESVIAEAALVIEIPADQLLSAEEVEERFKSWKAKQKETSNAILALNNESDQLRNDLAVRIAQNCCKEWSDEIKQDTLILYDQMIDALKSESQMLGARQYRLKKSIKCVQKDRQNLEDHYAPLMSLLMRADLMENNKEQKGARQECEPQPAA